MNQFYSAASVLLAALLGPLHVSAHAQEMYKWTDANGTVHYGDRAAAPEGGKKMNIAVPPPSQPPAVPAPPSGTQPRPPPPHLDAQSTSVPVGPARVGSECKGLIDKIAAVKRGQNWEALYREFDNACPGIAYECTEYRSNPQNNQCMWIERSGNNVLNRKSYP